MIFTLIVLLMMDGCMSSFTVASNDKRCEISLLEQAGPLAKATKRVSLAGHRDPTVHS
jgi:hypothetical protein